MPLTKTNTNNAIRGHLAANQAQMRDCHAVIGQLAYADLSRGAGTLHTSGVARLDMQGTTSNGSSNLQVQIGNDTVAAALIAPSAQATSDQANQRGLAQGARSVLEQSLDSATVWELTGALP